MVYKVDYVDYNNKGKFPEEIQKLYKVYKKETIMVITDDTGTRYFKDKGNSENNSFFRDWKWVAEELHKAYAQGLNDGQSSIISKNSINNITEDNNKWIDAKDKLPKEREELMRVLLSISFEGKNYTRCGWLRGYSFYWTGWPYKGSSAKVTHWKLWPKPYEGE